MKQLGLLMALVFAVAGCGQKSSKSEVPLADDSVFDDILARPSVSNRVKQIEQDLPGDVHKSIGEGTVRPMRWNDSRQIREREFARELLGEFQPSLKQMSVPDLLSALKLYPRITFDDPRGVAYYLYGEGNKMIIEEIESRPVEQLDSLKELTKDQKFEIFLNETQSAELGHMCQEILKMKGAYP